MKKLSLLALLLLAFVATAASAETLTCPQDSPAYPPTPDRQYNCIYPQGPWTNEALNPAWSIFTSQVGVDPIWAIEIYRATTHTGQDNRRVAFAKFKNLPAFNDPDCWYGAVRTVFEFTTAPIQCTNTVVSNFGHRIAFNGCNNGKTRVCTY